MAINPAHGPGDPVPGPEIAVVGAGSIGVAFAVLFATAGVPVRLWDPDPAARARALTDVRDRVAQLAAHGRLSDDPAAVIDRVVVHSDLADAVRGVGLIQECAPEILDLKQELFGRVGELAPASAVLASSSSAIIPSRIAAALSPDVASRVIVGHPANPPHLLPIIEVVPSASTTPAVTDQACGLYRAAGLRAVVVRKEIEGFLFNRLQGALLREAYCLVRDGVADVDDIDEVVRSGLGRRWSVIGPFETADLNTRGGIRAHAAKMGPAYQRMGAERGQDDPWTDELVDRVEAQRRDILPLENWEAAVRWRDEQLLRGLSVWESGDRTPTTTVDPIG